MRMWDFSLPSNWLLRNSCLKVLTELLFTYSRDEYEALSINALADSYTYPNKYRISLRMMDSYKGRSYHIGQGSGIQ